MKKPLPIGISDFKKLIDEGYAYVDKSLFIQEILEKGIEVALIPRIRRFGKTLNLSMLQYFFEKTLENNSYLFKNLKIWTVEKYRQMQGQFPVVFMTFKDLKHSSWEKTFDHFKRLISEEFQRHRYLLESGVLSAEEKDDYQAILRKEGSEPLYESSLRLLVKWLSLYHQKPVVLLIDEYDAPAHAAYTGKYYDALIEFLRNLLSGCLKDSRQLKLAVLTGILRIAKESIFSGLNNVKPFTILHESFQDKFGLLESEVRELLQEYGLSEKLTQIRKWYDGYQIGSCKGIYNPWSVLNAIFENGHLDSYWVNTSENTLMKQLISRGGAYLKADVEELIKGGFIEKKIEEGVIFSDLEKGSHAIWPLLLYTGYLTLEGASSEEGVCRLKIPNLEILKLYRSLILNWFEKSIEEGQYRQLLESLVKGDIMTFSTIFQNFVMNSPSVLDIPFEESEKIYHAFVLGILVGLGDAYEVKSNRESGLGRYDVTLFPKHPHDLGIVMEFKKADSPESLQTAATAALAQIEEKQYAQELLSRGVRKILLLGFAFKGKQLLIQHQFRSLS